MDVELDANNISILDKSSGIEKNWILLMKIYSVYFFANHIALPWTI